MFRPSHSDVPTFHISDRRPTVYRELPSVFEFPFDALKTSVTLWMENSIPGEDAADQIEYFEKYSGIQSAKDAIVTQLGLFIQDQAIANCQGYTIYHTLNNDFFKRLALYHPQGLFLPMNRFFMHTYSYKGARFHVEIDTVHLSDWDDDEANLLDPLICTFAHRYVYSPSKGAFLLLPLGAECIDNSQEFS